MKKIYKKLSIITFAFVFATNILASSFAFAIEETTIDNCYEIELSSVEYHSNDTSTWIYTITQKEGCEGPGISHWVWQPCFDLETLEDIFIEASPEPYAVGVDGSTGYYGVKWEISEPGTFSITIEGHPEIADDNTTAVIKPGSAFFPILVDGPSCAPAPYCELVLTKEDNADPVNPGDELIYSLRLENVGTANCTGGGVRIKDVFDPNTEYISSSKTPETIADTYIKWNFGTVTPGEVEELDLTMLVSEEAECGSVLINKAKFWSDQTDWGEYVIEETTIECEYQECITDDDCDDGLWCNGPEICVDNECVSGTSVDCSGNDLTSIETCGYGPDDNPFTRDFFAGFISECNECTDECTASTIELTHTCNIELCDAECEEDSDCPDTICEDGCVGNDYYDYDNVINTCQGDCTCADNSCGEATITYDAPACTACQTNEDCDDLDEDYCEGAVIMHDEGICENFECIVETTPGIDCDDGLYCNGQESCSNANCTQGTVVDCSSNNIDDIETCSWDPDNNPFTWDFRYLFISQCDEDLDACTEGDETITHTCDTECDAECISNEDCEEGGTCIGCVCEYESEPECGDGNLDSGEECDNGTSNGQACDPSCDSACTYCSNECLLVSINALICGGGGGGGTPSRPRLIIEKIVEEGPINPGSTIEFTITVENKGRKTAYNVILEDTLPIGFVYADTGLTFREWDFGDMKIGDSKTITYNATLNEGLGEGDYVNTAYVNASNHSKIFDDAIVPITLGAVLGERTELPSTGTSPLAYMLIGFSIMIFAGIGIRKIVIN